MLRSVHSQHLQLLVATAAPGTTAKLGIGTGHATQLLVTAGQNVDRLRSETAFAHLCGAAPVPASSGKTTRYRLNWGGDRQANAALHLCISVESERPFRRKSNSDFGPIRTLISDEAEQSFRRIANSYLG
jgi:transposase